MTTPADYLLLIERINSLVKEVDEKLGQVDRAFQKGVDVLNDLAEWLGELLAQARDALIKLKRMIDTEVRKLRAELDKFLVGLAVPLVMMEMDDKWLAIRNAANDVVAKVQNPGDRLDRFWEGPAATKYVSIVTPQVEAAKRLGAIAEKTSTTLQDMAAHTMLFYLALATAIGVIIGGLITAIVGLAGGVTAPIGVGGIVVALGAAIALAGAAYNFAVQQDKNGSILEGEATNPAGFAAGPSWPKAAAMSTDVTARDGDAADWRPVPQQP
jgi:hypothetical protein